MQKRQLHHTSDNCLHSEFPSLPVASKGEKTNM